ncbi:MAG: hypothetical protein H6729_08930 [Deltaproteobacteria bacterium]|nr:hypothetical protein [Deltaproteobacteria bacterium]
MKREKRGKGEGQSATREAQRSRDDLAQAFLARAGLAGLAARTDFLAETEARAAPLATDFFAVAFFDTTVLAFAKVRFARETFFVAGAAAGAFAGVLVAFLTTRFAAGFAAALLSTAFFTALLRLLTLDFAGALTATSATTAGAATVFVFGFLGVVFLGAIRLP